MALPPLADLSALAARLGAPFEPGAERERAAALLSDASVLVRHEAGRTWIDAEGELAEVPDIAVTTTLMSATRAWYNPASVDSQQLGAVSVRFGDVWLTAAERSRLKGLGQAGLSSIKLTPGFGFETDDTTGWAPVDYLDVGTPTPGADWAPIGY